MRIESKISFPLKECTPNKVAISNKSIGIIIERRKPVVKTDLSSINDFGVPFDITRLLFTRN